MDLRTGACFDKATLSTGEPAGLCRKHACGPHYKAAYFYWLPEEMPASQQRDKDNHSFDHQQHAQPSDPLANRFWVSHKVTDVGEDEAQHHMVDVANGVPVQAAHKPCQPHRDEHRCHGLRIVLAQRKVLSPSLAFGRFIPSPRATLWARRIRGIFADPYRRLLSCRAPPEYTLSLVSIPMRVWMGPRWGLYGQLCAKRFRGPEPQSAPQLRLYERVVVSLRLNEATLTLLLPSTNKALQDPFQAGVLPGGFRKSESVKVWRTLCR